MRDARNGKDTYFRLIFRLPGSLSKLLETSLKQTAIKPNYHVYIEESDEISGA